MDEFLVHLGVPITPCALQIRCGPPTRSALDRTGPIGRAFRCFNGSLLSITIGFMDEQVPRYGELSAWLLARAGMTFPPLPPTNCPIVERSIFRSVANHNRHVTTKDTSRCSNVNVTNRA